jgi:hypothetical protein
MYMVNQDVKSKIQFNEGTIKQSMGTDSFSKGNAYQTQKRVLEAAVDPENMKLVGTVRGKSMPRYAVVVSVGKYTLSGTCSCPVHSNCKHCVALCIEWLRNPEGFHLLENIKIVGDAIKKHAQNARSGGRFNGNNEDADEIGSDDDGDHDGDDVDVKDNDLDENALVDEDGDENEEEREDEDADDVDEDDPKENDKDNDDAEDGKVSSRGRKGGSRVVIISKIEPPGQIPDDLAEKSAVPEQAIFNAISTDALKSWFVQAWERNYPSALEPFSRKVPIFAHGWAQ